MMNTTSFAALPSRSFDVDECHIQYALCLTSKDLILGMFKIIEYNLRASKLWLSPFVSRVLDHDLIWIMMHDVPRLRNFNQGLSVLLDSIGRILSLVQVNTSSVFMVYC